MKNKKGFTLIELLAVIIILGILMIIAIPSVTKYINDSRKSSYVDTAKEVVAGTRNVVNEGILGMYDTDTTYYIPAGYIKTENALKSPYGEFVYAYTGVIYDGKGYKYYWISVDDTGQGVKNIVLADKLESDDIVSDINKEEIMDTITSTGIGNRHNIKILNENGTWKDPIYLSDTSNNISEDGSESGSGISNNEISIIETCPNCVYMYPTENIYLGANASTITSDMYVTNYKTITQNGEVAFIGAKLNSTKDKIEKAYVCGFATNSSTNEKEVFCIEGILDEYSNAVEMFNTNSSYMENSGYFGDSCWLETSTRKHIDCTIKSNYYALIENNYFSYSHWETSIYEYDDEWMAHGCQVYNNYANCY